MRRVMIGLGACLVVMGTACPTGPAGAEPRAGGDQLWVARYDGPGHQYDDAYEIAASPDGSRVYVAGDSDGRGGSSDIATVAYDAANGGQLWVQRYGTRNNEFDYVHDIEVSPDGTKVFITGARGNVDTASDWGTVAYDSVTGGKIWDQRYRAGRFNDAWALVPSPDGSMVFVAGAVNLGEDIVIIAYDAATGQQRWLQSYDGPGYGGDDVWDIDVSPDGRLVFVAGESTGDGTSDDFTTLAYATTDGTLAWVARYNGPNNYRDVATSIEVSPDGSRVFVAGSSQSPDTANHYATVAYDAATGAPLWARQSHGQGYNDDGTFLVLSPDGSKVFVTGSTEVAGTDNYDYGTVAYDAATGGVLWKQRYDDAGEGDYAYGITVAPDGATVVVTGYSYATSETASSDYATVAYETAHGQQLWVARYDGPGFDRDEPYDVAMSPNGATVYVTGRSTDERGFFDYATVAYEV
jgi:WD40 repeat protein